jgi:hypothetical protein
LGDLVARLHADLGRPGAVLSTSMLTAMGVRGQGLTAALFECRHQIVCLTSSFFAGFRLSAFGADNLPLKSVNPSARRPSWRRMTSATSLTASSE